MTEQIKQKLKDILIEHKNIAASEYNDEDAFVGIYFDDLVDIIDSIIYNSEWNNYNWISVKDKLPPENGKTKQSVNVWATDGLTSGEFWYNFDTKTWTDIFGDPFDITHWIPFPQLPRK